MGVRDEQLQKRAGWPLGINNLAAETKLPVGEDGAPLAVRESENFDFDGNGMPKLRPGRTAVLAGSTHSAWSHDLLAFGLFVDGAQLKAFWPGARTELLVDGLAPGQPVSYDLFHDVVLWSNGSQSGAIWADLDAGAWSCPNPASRPDIASASDGALDPGTYQVAITFIDARGRESGAALATEVVLPNGGALDLSNIPQPHDAGDVPQIRIYATAGNDGVLRAALRVPAGTLTARIAQRPEGQPLETQHLQRMPPGHIVRAHNGRQFVARDNEVLFSQAFRPGLFDPRARVVFKGRITMMQPVGDGGEGAGLFVADGARTYFLAAGDPMNWRQVVANPYGAVPGSPAVSAGGLWPGLQTKEPLPVWLSTNGRFCVGMPGGQIYQPQPRQDAQDAVIDAAHRAALLIRESEGLNQVIAALQGSQPRSMALGDRLIGRVYEHFHADPG